MESPPRGYCAQGGGLLFSANFAETGGVCFILEAIVEKTSADARKKGETRQGLRGPETRARRILLLDLIRRWNKTKITNGFSPET